MTDCQCAGDTCDRTGRPVTGPMRERCRTDRRYQLTLLGVPRQEWPEELRWPRRIEKTSKSSQPPNPLKPPCIYLGPVIEPARCNNGAKSVHHCLYDGHDFERCVRGGVCGAKSKEIQSCQKCAHHTTAKIATRHLAYFVYPVSGNGVWQSNVDQLLERIDLFNGRRLVCIAAAQGVVRPRKERIRKSRPPHTVDPPEMVRERMQGHGIEFTETANDVRLGEVPAFTVMLDKLKDHAGESDVTFYGHAKGVSRPVNPGVSVHPWASLLYAANLDYWPVVEDLLTRFPVVGAMKTNGRAINYLGSWHYSGTFFWFRNRDVFSRDWSVPQFWGGVECWPGKLFPPNESGCVFWEEPIPPRPTGYDFPRLRTVLAEFAVWSQKNANHRRPGAVPRPWLIHGYE